MAIAESSALGAYHLEFLLACEVVMGIDGDGEARR